MKLMEDLKLFPQSTIITGEDPKIDPGEDPKIDPTMTWGKLMTQMNNVTDWLMNVNQSSVEQLLMAMFGNLDYTNADQTTDR